MYIDFSESNWKLQHPITIYRILSESVESEMNFQNPTWFSANLWNIYRIAKILSKSSLFGTQRRIVNFNFVDQNLPNFQNLIKILRILKIQSESPESHRNLQSPIRIIKIPSESSKPLRNLQNLVGILRIILQSLESQMNHIGIFRIFSESSKACRNFQNLVGIIWISSIFKIFWISSKSSESLKGNWHQYLIWWKYSRKAGEKKRTLKAFLVILKRFWLK